VYDEEESNVDDEEDTELGHVVSLTDSNFEEVVTKSANDVMLEFYAPWCGHCKALKTVYKRVAEKLKAVSSVTIAAMDATENTVPDGFNVEGNNVTVARQSAHAINAHVRLSHSSILACEPEIAAPFV
jgi:thioredoxin-like negative regulator of GroEL